MTVLSGHVTRGDGIGKKLGFPTANLQISREKIQLSDGVYAAWVTLRRKKYKSAFVIISNPVKTEAFLIDYEGGNFYGEEIDVEPVQKIGEVEKYEKEKELIKKIENDVSIVQEVLKYSN